MNDPEKTLAEVMAWLDTLEPLQRIRWLGALLDRRNRARLSALRVETIYQATRRGTYDVVAAELGVSWSAVHKAVKAHGVALKAAEGQ